MVSKTVVVAGMRIFTMTAGLAISALLSRMLTIDQLGTYFLIASLVQVGALISLGGFNQSAVPLIAGTLAGETPHRLAPTLRSIVVFLVISVCLLSAVMVVFFEDILNVLGASAVGYQIILLAIIWMISRWFFLGSAHALRAFGHMDQFGLLDTFLFNILLLLALTWLFVTKQNLDLGTVMIWVAIAAATCVPVAGVLLWRRLRQVQQSKLVPTYATSDILRVGMPLWIIVIASAGLLDAHLWIAGGLGGEEVAALFGIATRVVRALLLPVLALNMAAGPRVAQLWRSGDIDGLQTLLRVAASTIAIVSFIILAAFLIAGANSLAIAFGPEFVAAWPVFLLMLAGQTINGVLGMPMLLLTVSNSQRAAMVISIFGGVVGIVVSLHLGRTDPLWGVAIGMTSAAVLQNVIAAIYCKVKLGINTLPTLRIRAAIGEGV